MSYGRARPWPQSLRYGFLAIAAAASIHVFTPAAVITRAIQETCADALFAVDLNTMYDLTTPMPPVVSNPKALCPGPGFNSFLVDLAPDGSYYGFVATDSACTPLSTRTWGRIDPKGANTVESPFYVPLEDAPSTVTAPVPGIAFLDTFPAPGSPIGYRFDRGTTAAPNVQLFAIDALSPYREHVLYSNLAPPSQVNFGIGTALSNDGTKAYFVTTSQVLELNLQTGPPIAQTGFLSLYRISRNAMVASSSGDGFYIADGGALFYYDMATGDVSSALAPPLSQMVDISRYPCTAGGMRIEPHEQLVTTESGGTATFTAVLTAQPSQNVIVNFASTDTTEGTVSPSSATFTNSNWSTPQTITVTGALDSDTSNQTYRITTSALSSADTNFNGRTVLDVDVTNTHVNQAPAMTADTPSARQGSPAATATLGTVSDLETAAGSLTVTTVSVPAGLTVGTITNAGGTVTAPLSASCSATTGARTLTMRVTDAASATFDRDVTVTVNADTAPTLGTYGNAVVTAGNGTTVSASAAPGDNGSIADVSVSSTSFTGTLSVNASTGQVTIGNAGPVGAHVVTVTVTDNCGMTFERTFNLTVNAIPTMVAASPSSQQGSPATGATLGTVSDAETAAESLTVTTVSIPTGLTVGAITNTSGTITAPLTATCSATTGDRTLTLRVTDALGATFDRDVIVNVIANTAPAFGTYGAISIAHGASTTGEPSAAPTDNGSVALLEAAAPGFTGTLSANLSTGVVSIDTATPAGTRTVTVTATDNCGATAARTFDLTIACPAIALASPGATFSIGGGSGSVGVITDPGCAWSGSSPVSWIAFNTSSGSGNGSATFTVDQNRTGMPRSANLTITDRTFSVTQETAFSDASVTAGATPIRALHIVELRLRVDSLRSRLGMTAYAWTDPSLTAESTVMRAIHITDVRTALSEAYGQAQHAGPSFTDAIVAGETVVRAVHLTELRTAVETLEGLLPPQ